MKCELASDPKSPSSSFNCHLLKYILFHLYHLWPIILFFMSPSVRSDFGRYRTTVRMDQFELLQSATLL
ncbi:hypothetical protein BDV34DRAFT_195309 [Aspergillus parasiticus]|uniref:Uncharacterized protein n=1 Tax=Aspergillus parasiticus TaxID=5067 RepID=A0A5N6DN59_ASPPA|nr:hypothetical protein BDV34DRAFT_195309 [Aspergillus parasiticus]